MTRKSIATFGILLMLLVSIIGTAAGQSGTDPEVTPTPTTEEEQAGTKFFTHPVVQLLSKYFDRDVDLTVDPTVDGTPDPNATPDPLATDVPEDSLSGLGPIGEQIAAYHEDGMGFGVLVKLYAMAEASEEACAAQEEPVIDEETGQPVECVPLTAEELVEAFRSGTGMGALFKEHGKPALLGVGHVKKALKAQEAETEISADGTDTVIETGDETLQNKKPMKQPKPAKVKSNNGKGPKKP